MGDLLVKLTLAAVALAVSAIGAAQDDASSLDDILVEAESSSIDGQSNRAHFRRLKITQGDLSIEAADAVVTGVDFEDREWTLSGGVRVVVDSAVLESESAVFKFRGNELERGELAGDPASFTDRKTREQPASGSAEKITYNNVAHTLRLSENARIVKGSSEIVGCELIYDFDEERVTSGSSGCPVRYRIVPQSQSEDNDANSASGP
jgi:lipopolysaccharide transport protein LptA